MALGPMLTAGVVAGSREAIVAAAIDRRAMRSECPHPLPETPFLDVASGCRSFRARPLCRVPARCESRCLSLHLDRLRFPVRRVPRALGRRDHCVDRGWITALSIQWKSCERRVKTGSREVVHRAFIPVPGLVQSCAPAFDAVALAGTVVGLSAVPPPCLEEPLCVVLAQTCRCDA